MGLLVFLIALDADAQMYKCVDERGKIQYTDKPQAGCKESRSSRAAALRLRRGEAAAQEDSQREDADLKRRQLERAAVEAQERKVQEALGQSCARLRGELSLLTGGARISSRNAQASPSSWTTRRAPGASPPWSSNCALPVSRRGAPGSSCRAQTRRPTPPRRARARTSSCSSWRLHTSGLAARARSLSSAAFDRWRKAGALAAVRINPLETDGMADLAAIASPDVLMMSKSIRRSSATPRGGRAAGRRARAEHRIGGVACSGSVTSAAASGRVSALLVASEDMGSSGHGEEPRRRRARVRPGALSRRVPRRGRRSDRLSLHLSDTKGAVADARYAKQLGYRMKSLVDPSHAKAINAVFFAFTRGAGEAARSCAPFRNERGPRGRSGESRRRADRSAVYAAASAARRLRLSALRQRSPERPFLRDGPSSWAGRRACAARSPDSAHETPGLNASSERRGIDVGELPLRMLGTDVRRRTCHH